MAFVQMAHARPSDVPLAFYPLHASTSTPHVLGNEKATPAEAARIHQPLFAQVPGIYQYVTGVPGMASPALNFPHHYNIIPAGFQISGGHSIAETNDGGQSITQLAPPAMVPGFDFTPSPEQFAISYYPTWQPQSDVESAGPFAHVVVGGMESQSHLAESGNFTVVPIFNQIPISYASSVRSDVHLGGSGMEAKLPDASLLDPKQLWDDVPHSRRASLSNPALRVSMDSEMVSRIVDDLLYGDELEEASFDEQLASSSSGSSMYPSGNHHLGEDSDGEDDTRDEVVLAQVMDLESTQNDEDGEAQADCGQSTDDEGHDSELEDYAIEVQPSHSISVHPPLALLYPDGDSVDGALANNKRRASNSSDLEDYLSYKRHRSPLSHLPDARVSAAAEPQPSEALPSPVCSIFNPLERKDSSDSLRSAARLQAQNSSQSRMPVGRKSSSTSSAAQTQQRTPPQTPPASKAAVVPKSLVTRLSKLTPEEIDGRTFKCDNCPASFVRKHDLRRHERIHLGVKPYVCKYCSKAFARLDAMNRHTLLKNCKRPGAWAEAVKSGSDSD